jgi:hypothetical protein
VSSCDLLNISVASVLFICFGDTVDDRKLDELSQNEIDFVIDHLAGLIKTRMQNYDDRELVF